MKTHDVIQGSPEWVQFRLEHNGASEAAGMLGLSPKLKRTELLRMKHTGNPKEFSDFVKTYVLDPGHEVEALCRPLMEGIIGEDLYPVTVSDGKLSASCDGLNISDEIAWEHKQWNAELAASVQAGIVPDEYMPQCQQILMVTGAKKVIFTVSDGTPDKLVYVDVLPDPAWFERIVAGWAQFEKDLIDYTPVDYPDKPEAAVIERLPALAVLIKGEVVASNLPSFKAAAETYIAKINTELVTDKHFVDADADAKFCRETAKKLEVAKESALAQTASIDELVRTVDGLCKQLNAKGLALEKLVDARKLQIKNDAIAEARVKFAAHIAELDAELKTIHLPYAMPDFAEAAKNKRTLESLHNAIDTMLSNGKIAADALAKDYRAKLAWINENGKGYVYPDLQALMVKPLDDFQLTVHARIQRIEDDAERVRQEEQGRLAQQQAEAATQTAAAIAPAVSAIPTPAPVQTRRSVGLPERLMETNEKPTLRLGEICERLGFTVTADFLAELGYTATIERNAKLYRESNWPAICEALIQHITEVSDLQPA